MRRWPNTTNNVFLDLLVCEKAHPRVHEPGGNAISSSIGFGVTKSDRFTISFGVRRDWGLLLGVSNYSDGVSRG